MPTNMPMSGMMNFPGMMGAPNGLTPDMMQKISQQQVSGGNPLMMGGGMFPPGLNMQMNPQNPNNRLGNSQSPNQPNNNEAPNMGGMFMVQGMNPMQGGGNQEMANIMRQQQMMEMMKKNGGMMMLGMQGMQGMPGMPGISGMPNLQNMNSMFMPPKKDDEDKK